MPLFILADDLTGAADSAARCHHAGLAAHVYLSPPVAAWPEGAVAFSTDSRYLAPTEAAGQVSTLLTALAAPQPAQWYKKIDSTLRGNIGAELDAMLAALSPQNALPCAVICPAFPAQGRGLLDGCLVYEQGSTPGLHLPTLLAAQTARPVAALPLSVVWAGVAQLAEALQMAQRQGAQLIVVDAMSEDDLGHLVAATQQALPQALLCGSAGLIEPLARELAKNSPGRPPENPDVSALHKPMLAVIGSGSQMTHRQLAALRQRSDVRCLALTVDSPVDLAGDLPSDSSGPNAAGVLAAGTDWALHLPQPDEQVLLEGALARQSVAHLTQMAVEWINYWQPQTLLVVGGDTAVHLLHRLGIQQLTIVRELMPGIPLCVGRDALGQQRQIITKAGNFGDEETLVRLFQAGSRE